MKSRFNILTSMERAFLSVQTKVKSLKEGSVLRSLLYAVSSELEKLYTEVDTISRNMNVNEATGDALDDLIEGFSKVRRKQATRAAGYVVVEFGTPLTEDNIDDLDFSFARFDQSAQTLDTDYPGAIRVTTNVGGGERSYYICQPLIFDFDDADYLVDPDTGKQRLLSKFKEFLHSIYVKRGKRPIKYVILPAAATQPGANGNLQSESIDVVGNMGLPVIIRNSYVISVDESKFSYADVDGILSLPQGGGSSKVLGENAFFTGGSDTESDQDYRDRYHLYLRSLSKGTLSSLEFAIKTLVPNVQVKAVESASVGTVNVFLDSPHVMSKNLISKVDGVVKEYKPAGVLVNLRPSKVSYITVLTDVEGGELESATERLRRSVNSRLERKGIEEPLSYSELNESLDIPSIGKVDNVYYGLYLTPELYNLYRDTFEELFSSYSPHFKATAKNYRDWKNVVISGEIRLFDRKESKLKYPLVQLVRRAKELIDAYDGDADTYDLFTDEKDPNHADHLNKIIQSISKYCMNTRRARDCLDKLRKEPALIDLAITIKDVEAIVGKRYANYYRIKMMTVPPVITMESDKAIEYIEYFVNNDVLLHSYDDMPEAELKPFTKLRIANDSEVNGSVYKLNHLVGTRPVER